MGDCNSLHQLCAEMSSSSSNLTPNLTRVSFRSIVEEDARLNNCGPSPEILQLINGNLKRAPTTFIRCINGPWEKCEFKVRIISKSLNPNTRVGEVLSLVLMDENQDYITCVAWQETASNFNSKLKVDHVYQLQDVSITNMKENDKPFSWVESEWKIELTRSSKVEEIENNSCFPLIKFNFANYDDIDGLPESTAVDIIGLFKWQKVVQNVYDESECIGMIDKTKTEIIILDTEKIRHQLEPGILEMNQKVLSFKGVRKVRKTLGKVICRALKDTAVQVDYDSPEFRDFKAWMDE